MVRTVSFNVGRFTQNLPRLATIVTSQSQGKENAMALAWHSVLSFAPPLIGISVSPRRLSYKLIMESKEFGINFLPLEKVDLVVAVGATKGGEIDKFETFHIQKVKPAKTSVPILDVAYAAYECSLVDHRTYGDHEWFVGEILATHVSSDVLTDKELLDLNQVQPILYLGSDHYVAVDKDSLRYLDRQPYQKA